MIDRTKKSTTLTIILIVAIIGFMGMAQLKLISADVAVSTSGLCIVSLVIIVIKDMVMSNRQQENEKIKEVNKNSNNKI